MISEERKSIIRLLQRRLGNCRAQLRYEHGGAGTESLGGQIEELTRLIEELKLDPAMIKRRRADSLRPGDVLIGNDELFKIRRVAIIQQGCSVALWNSRRIQPMIVGASCTYRVWRKP